MQWALHQTGDARFNFLFYFDIFSFFADQDVILLRPVLQTKDVLPMNSYKKHHLCSEDQIT
jgi:hypothetical protein